MGEIIQQRPRHRTRTRTGSCPSTTGPVSWTTWTSWSGWTQTGTWMETSNTCEASACSGSNSRTEWRPYQNNCPAGQWGVVNRERELVSTRTCNAGTWSAWGGWSTTGATRPVSSTCSACDAPITETRMQWQDRSASCPSSQGSHTWQEQRNQSRTGTYDCSAGPQTHPDLTWGDWTNVSWTGNKRSESNTCGPVGPILGCECPTMAVVPGGYIQAAGQFSTMAECEAARVASSAPWYQCSNMTLTPQPRACYSLHAPPPWGMVEVECNITGW